MGVVVDPSGLDGAPSVVEGDKPMGVEALHDARHKIETWRRDYNRVRSHNAVGNVPPEEYAALQELRLPTADSAPAGETRNRPRLTLGLRGKGG